MSPLASGRAVLFFVAQIIALMNAGSAAARDCEDLREVRRHGNNAVRELVESRIQTAHNRIALVVGNNYQRIGEPLPNSLPTLKNAIPDAISVTRMLSGMKFNVLCLLNVRNEELLAASYLVGHHNPLDGIAVFYFAGHGFSLDGENFLVTDEASLSSWEDLLAGSFAASEVGLHLTLSSKNELMELADQPVPCETMGRRVRCRTGEEIFMKAAFPRPTIMIFDICREVLHLQNQGAAKDLGAFVSPAQQTWPLASLTVWAAGPNEFASDLPQEANGMLVKHLLRFFPQSGRTVEERIRYGLDALRESPGVNVNPQWYASPLSSFWNDIRLKEGDSEIQNAAASKLSKRQTSLITFSDCQTIGSQRGLLRASVASNQTLETERQRLRADLLQLFRRGCTTAKMAQAVYDNYEPLRLGSTTPTIALRFFSFEPILAKTSADMSFSTVANALAAPVAQAAQRVPAGAVVALVTPTTWQLTRNTPGRVVPPSSSRAIEVQSAASEAAAQSEVIPPTTPARAVISLDGLTMRSSESVWSSIPIDTKNQLVVDFKGPRLSTLSRAKLLDFAKDPEPDQLGFVLIMPLNRANDRSIGDLRHNAVSYVLREQNAIRVTAGEAERDLQRVQILGTPRDSAFILVPGLKNDQALMLRVRDRSMEVAVTSDFENGGRSVTTPFEAPDPYEGAKTLTPKYLASGAKPHEDPSAMRNFTSH